MIQFGSIPPPYRKARFRKKGKCFFSAVIWKSYSSSINSTPKKRGRASPPPWLRVENQGVVYMESQHLSMDASNVCAKDWLCSEGSARRRTQTSLLFAGPIVFCALTKDVLDKQNSGMWGRKCIAQRLRNRFFNKRTSEAISKCDIHLPK